jgi:hypothetical protein
MWLAVVLACTSPFADSCQVLAKSDELFYSEAACMEETDTMVLYLTGKGVRASPRCFKVGEAV